MHMVLFFEASPFLGFLPTPGVGTEIITPARALIKLRYPSGEGKAHHKTAVIQGITLNAPPN
jgi:hypothetical protein